MLLTWKRWAITTRRIITGIVGTTGVITGQRATIRKVLTPKMAKLSLSSVALRDGIVHGLPVTGGWVCIINDL